MQNARERQVVFFDLAIGTTPPGRLPPMNDIAEFLIERVDAGLASRYVESERFLIGITAARVLRMHGGPPALAMLFVFVDPDAADPANMHIETRDVRFFNKLEGEGRAVSAHVVMDLTPRHPQGHIFRVLLEAADRLGKTRVRAHLAEQFRQVFQDKEITVDTVDGEDAPARPKLDMSAVASERLRQGLKDGRLKEVTLVDARAKDRGFDAPGPVEVRRREMALKVEVPAGQTIEQVLNSIKPWARGQQFEEMYVRWDRQPAVAAGGSDRPERAKINLAHEDIGETLFARKEFVSLTRPMGDLVTAFNDEMLDAMAGLLR